VEKMKVKVNSRVNSAIAPMVIMLPAVSHVKENLGRFGRDSGEVDNL
jgi:hypothetical protein